ncbi:MAG: hypothetical protein WCD35_09340 [Mycobacteriales bacterium]
MTCQACGATSRAGAEWCTQCHLPFAVAAVPARLVPAAAPAVVPVYSRWRKTDTSFGPLGRVLWTVSMTAVAALFLFSMDLFAIVGWCGIAMPLVLRSVWARGRVS